MGSSSAIFFKTSQDDDLAPLVSMALKFQPLGPSPLSVAFYGLLFHALKPHSDVSAKLNIGLHALVEKIGTGDNVFYLIVLQE